MIIGYFTWISTEKQLSAHAGAMCHWTAEMIGFIHGQGYIQSQFSNSDCVPLHLTHQVRRLAIVSKARFSPHNSRFVYRSIINENYLKEKNRSALSALATAPGWFSQSVNYN